jgi:hypothetical protein
VPRLRRLTNREYEAAVRDLVGPSIDLLTALPPDPRVKGFENNAQALTVTEGNLEEYARAAELVAGAVSIAELAPCDGEAAGCARTFVDGFCRRAFGRAPSAQERDRLLALFNLGSESGGYEGGIRLVVEATLQSPSFLYRTELGAENATGPVALTGAEIAARISFFLTGRRPDAALLADEARLTDATAIERHVRRLLATDDARDRLRAFFLAWLGLAEFDRVTKDPDLFPGFTPAVKREMEVEFRELIDRALWGAEGTLDHLFTDNHTVVGEALAVLYGTDLRERPEAGLATLYPGHRRGILSLPGVLATHAIGEGTSPVERGLLVRVDLLCDEVLPPPPNVPPLAGDPENRPRTTRERFADHTAQPACRPCHQRIDPIGFGFEQMDSLGRFRAEENKLPIDSSGVLDDAGGGEGPFTGPAELGERLVQSRKLRACFVKQLYRDLEGEREPERVACGMPAVQALYIDQRMRITDLIAAMLAREAQTGRSP